MNPDVTARINESQNWRKEFETLRAILLNCGLTEEFKWEEACYTLEGANIALLHGFKEYCAILFFKGALMKDPQGILIQQTENVQAGRQIRFTSVQQIEKMRPVIEATFRRRLLLRNLV